MEFNTFNQASPVYPGTSELEQSIQGDAISANPCEFPGLNATRSGSGSGPTLKPELEPVNLTNIDPKEFIADNFGHKVRELSSALTNRSDSATKAVDSLMGDALGANTEVEINRRPASLKNLPKLSEVSVAKKHMPWSDDGTNLIKLETAFGKDLSTEKIASIKDLVRDNKKLDKKDYDSSTAKEEILTSLAKGDHLVKGDRLVQKRLDTLNPKDDIGTDIDSQAEDNTDNNPSDGQANMAAANASFIAGQGILPTITPMRLQHADGTQVLLLRGNYNFKPTVHIAINGQYYGQYYIPVNLGGGVQVQTKLQYRTEIWMGRVRQVQKVTTVAQWGSGWVRLQ